MLKYVVLAGFLALVAYIDIKSKKILNVFLIAMAFIGIVVNIFSFIIDSYKISDLIFLIEYQKSLDITDILLGIIIPLLALMPLWLIKALGAGDIKLLMVAGIYLGTDIILVAIYAFFIAAFVGIMLLVKESKLVKRIFFALRYSALLINSKKAVVYEYGIDNLNAVTVPFAACVFVAYLTYVLFVVIGG
ncbi:MAG: A24 family peptidase [Lachnospiraceae bacterium]|nr:A24 family peptidase [Lachnospiraceae bacterium]